MEGKIDLALFSQISLRKSGYLRSQKKKERTADLKIARMSFTEDWGGQDTRGKTFLVLVTCSLTVILSESVIECYYTCPRPI